MTEPPPKRARMSESPTRSPRLRTGSPGDRFAVSATGGSSVMPTTKSGTRPSVLASPRTLTESRHPFEQPSTPIRRTSIQPNQPPPHLTLPQPSSTGGYPGPPSSSRHPGSTGSSHVPLPSIGQISSAWTSSMAGYEPSSQAGPSSSRAPAEPVFRRESLGVISESQEGSESGTIGSRDPGRERAPRSMMACVRCRKQKMKCDGPAAAPCRGCKSVNTTCVFETRTRSSRPKSMSTLAPAQPLPAIMSSVTGTATNPPVYTHKPTRSLDPYSNLGGMSTASPLVRQGMPPPGMSGMGGIHAGPGGGMIALGPGGERIPGASPYTSSQAGYSTYQPHQPVPGHRGSFSVSSMEQARPSLSGYNQPPPGVLTSPVTPRAQQVSTSQTMFGIENRLRHLETSLRTIDALQANQVVLQNTVHYLEMQVRHLTGQLGEMGDMSITRAIRSGKGKEPERRVYISERNWDAYRTYIAPLSPWLVILTSPMDLSGEIVSALGSRPRFHSEPNESPGGGLGEMARMELARLVVAGNDWSRTDVHALGTFATWEGNSSLASLAIGQARSMAGRGRTDFRGTMEESRDVVELVLLEHTLWSIKAPEFVPASVKSSLAAPWRDRVRSHTPTVPSEKDHDVKMLAWLEYFEMLTEVQNGLLDPGLVREAREDARGVEDVLGRRLDYLKGWETWNGLWGGAGDPILTLHYHFAILLTTSPLLMRHPATPQTTPSKRPAPGSPGSDPTWWGRLVADHAGYEMLTRARDAAVALIRSISTPEIARTMHYSLPLFRTRVAFAITHLLAHTVALPHSTLTPIPLHQTTLRLAYERLGGGQTGSSPVGWVGIGETGLLSEVVRSGEITNEHVKSLIGEVEAGRIPVGKTLWDRVLGS